MRATCFWRAGVRWLAVAGWSGLVLYFSAWASMGGRNSYRLHFGAYAVLTGLLAWALQPLLRDRPRVLFLAALFLIALSAAVLHESFQNLFPRREGSWMDIAADLVGIVLALAVIGSARLREAKSRQP